MDSNKIRDAADAVKGLVKAVPIYEDTLQPAAKEIGTALQTVAKTIHIALAPVSALVWGYDQIKDWVSTKVAEKLKDVPPENITNPKPNVAGPALEALRYTGFEEALSDMYANLLAASMDTRTASTAHPAFVEIIRQLTPDEAKILRLLAQPNRPIPLLDVRGDLKPGSPKSPGSIKYLANFSLIAWEANCDYPNSSSVYLGNFCRLGLAEIPVHHEYTKPGIYEPLEEHPIVRQLFDKIGEVDMVPMIERKTLAITALGMQFCKACVISHTSSEEPDKNSGGA